LKLEEVFDMQMKKLTVWETEMHRVKSQIT
jgi:hypothetical protein